MCLEIRKGPLVANEDIVCYKRVIPSFDFSLIKNEDSFEGMIANCRCSGKIFIDENGKVFFCTDSPDCDGQSSSNKLGYKYSWALDNSVEKIKINGNIIPINNNYFITPYYGFIIKINEMYHSELNKVNDEIEEGFHSYENLLDAINHKSSNEEVIVKCIIPKDSTYYIGEFDDLPNYASDNIIIDSIINT